jgi:putative ABC transport system ATP-binding protein
MTEPVGVDDRVPVIALRGVGHSYPASTGTDRIVVLYDVYVELHPRELVCVAGRSGSGKTTLLSIAAFLLSPDRGAVSWRGMDPGQLDDAERSAMRRRTVGFVFQDAGLIGSLTAEENVAVAGARESSQQRARARELLEMVGVDGRASNFPAQLSGGERQRVGIARALYLDPIALLIDEPTANLDRTTADEIIDLLVDLRNSGHGLLVASHDARLAERADRIVTLD